MILFLQGCMAVGKTTAVKCLQKNAPSSNGGFFFLLLNLLAKPYQFLIKRHGALWGL